MEFKKDAITKNPYAATVVIYGRPECSNSVYTLQYLSKASWLDTEDIKVFYVDIDRNSAYTVTNFANTINDPRITFCYDTSGTARSYMWSNIGWGSYTLPIILYLNADGQVVFFESGPKYSSQILSSAKRAANIKKK